MRVFVTGATGFIGSAVVKELISAGHQVLGLARSEESAKSLTAAGAEVHIGSIEDLESLRNGAAATDGVIHTAFIHDFSKFKENCEKDRAAIEALGSALIGSDRPLVITSGTALVAGEKIATESDVPAISADAFPRVATEEAATLALSRGINVSVVRLPPSVHGDGDHGFVPLLIGVAKEKGAAAYIGEGKNVWPAVHRFDAARLFILAFEKAAKGAKYHGAAESGIAFKDIATMIGKGLNIPVVSKSREDAADHFGWFAHFAALNNPTSSEQTKQVLGWQPKEIGLIEDLQAGIYFL